MMSRPLPSFDALRKRAWRAAEALSDELAKGPLPVALDDLANRLRIRRIEFVPLLSTAGLVPVENGYAVLINERAPGADIRDKSRLSIEELARARLSAPLRFTIAHECAHIIFFNLMGGDCRNPIFRRHLKALESSCNRIARILLVPKARLAEFMTSSLAEPGKFGALARTFGVSQEVLVYRFRIDDLSDVPVAEDGMIAYLAQRGTEIKLLAGCSLGAMGRIRWKAFIPERYPEMGSTGSNKRRRKSSRQTDKGVAWQHLHLSSGLCEIIKRGNSVVTRANIPWDAADQFLPAEVKCRPIRQDPFSALLTIRVLGPLQRLLKQRFRADLL